MPTRRCEIIGVFYPFFFFYPSIFHLFAHSRSIFCQPLQIMSVDTFCKVDTFLSSLIPFYIIVGWWTCLVFTMKKSNLPDLATIRISQALRS